MKPFIKYSIAIFLLVSIVACQKTENFEKVELLKNVNIKNHQVALLQTNHHNNSKLLLTRADGIQVLKSLQTYVLHKQTASTNYSIQLLIDGKIEKELFFDNKPRWFTAHELASDPFEESEVNRLMFLPVVSSSNSRYAIYSIKNNAEFAYKEPHFINKYQGQTKQIKAEYVENTIIWNTVHYQIKPSAISKELKKAYKLVRSSPMQVVPLSVTVKIDKESMKVLQWDKLGNSTKTGINTEMKSTFREGDIIFQTSKSNQSKAIQLATKSPYSHMGIIYRQGVDYFVFEAIQPVKLTPLKEWIDRGENGHYVVKRLENADKLLTKDLLAKMKEIGEKYLNKDYDLYFEWSNTQIYCSELVWKIYKEALGIEIGKLAKLKDFDLTHPTVKQKLKERYGNNIPIEEQVISPATMFYSDKLMTVFSN